MAPYVLHHVVSGVSRGARLACVLALSACAQIPTIDAPITLKRMDQLASAQTFDEPTARWPDDAWWEVYGDAQLNALIDEALHDSPNLAVAEARLRQAGAMSQVAGAPLLPEVSGNAALTREKQSYNYLMPRAALPDGWKDYGRATLNLSWELDFWGKNRAALAAATSSQRAAQAELAQTRLIVSASVASAYAELIHLFTVRDTAKAALELRVKTADLFRRRNAFGLENLASVRQVEAREAVADAELQSIDERIALLRNAIAALVGAGPDRGAALSRPSAAFIRAPGLPSDLALELVGRRPDIVAARWRTEAAAHAIARQRAGFYPSVNLMAVVGVLSLGIDNLGKSGSDMGSAGPAISLPIFNTERLQGQLRGAHAEYDEAVAAYNATLTNALREVADVVASRKALEGELAATRAAVAAAADAHEIIARRYRGELATYLDVLSAEDALVSARRALADIETRALTLDVALARALGGGFGNGLGDRFGGREKLSGTPGRTE